MKPIPPVLLRYVEGLRTHDVSLVGSTVSDDLEFVAATRVLTRSDFLAMLTALYTGFPDWHYDHDPITWQGDMLAILWRQGGTHTGTWNLPGMDPIPPTGRSVTIPPHHFFYWVDGDRIVRIRPDPVPGGAPRGILQQIGVPLPPL